MKSTQLLSVVFSLIMFTGVTAGNAAFAESDDVDDILEDFCEMTLDEQSDVLSEYGLDDYAEKLAVICEIEDEDEREDSLEDVIDAMDLDMHDKTHDDSKDYRYETDDDFDLDDLLDDYCEMTDEEKRQLLADHPRLAPFSDRLANYCEMSEDEQDVIDELIEEHYGDKIRSELRDYSKDYRMDYKKDMREHLENYCEMSDEDRKAFVEENDKAQDHAEKMNRYCSLDEDDRMDFIEDHKDEYKAHMKEKMHEKMAGKKHMDYEMLCEMTDSERAEKIDNSEKLERLSDWCEMTPEEREEYKKEHHDKAKDDKKHAMKMNLSEKSDRIKEMIMENRDISNERREEIKMKYIEKHGDLTDERKSELKMKFKDHMKTVKHTISDERKSDIHDRLAEMKAFKAELREKSSELTDEEKQQLKEEFIEKAKDMQLAWISPHVQMTAGVDAAEVECRQGFSLVMKTSNGAAMCLKADSAIKMIDRGIVVPAI
ncbi:ABC transporter substrate-binding protein [archaeon]|nr:ABC transporter substrate-binding protein [archaeon]